VEAGRLALIDDEPRKHDCQDVTVDELKRVLNGLPVDELGLPKLSAISDKQLRAKFVEATERREKGSPDDG
jgi:hypothetical protein